VTPDLQRAAAVCDLAQMLWQVRARYYQLDALRWDQLELMPRLQFMQIAEDVLARLPAPAPVLPFEVHARD